MPYQALTLGQLLEQRANEYPGKAYLFFEDEEITYAEFNRRVNQVANGLLQMGIGKDTHVGIHLPNCPEFLYTAFALAKIGAPMVPTNLALTAGELSYIMGHGEVAAIITAPVYAEVVAAARSDCPLLQRVVMVGEPVPEGAVPFTELVSDGAADLQLGDAPLATDVLAIMYTSGTTSLPKGVMVTHQHFIEGGHSWMWAAGFTAKDRTLTGLPLYHVNAFVYSVIGSMVFGGSVALLERFSASQYFDQIRRYGATHINFAGPLMAMVMAQPESPTDADNPVRVASSAMGSPELNAAFEKRYQIKVLMGYTLTESVIGLSTPVSGPKPVKLGCLGVPSPSLPFASRARVVDDEGNDVPPGVTGEIILRTPAVMLSYYKQPDKTAEALKDGWLYTGDLGYVDEEGYFWFVDRKKDVIKRKGENIASAEVEFVLGNHPKVQECAVIGVPDPVAMEEVKACILLVPGETPETVPPQELIAWCQERLAPFKVPRYLEYRDQDFPWMLGAKILKRELKREKEDLTHGCYDRVAGRWLK